MSNEPVVFLIDDHQDLRDAVQWLLESVPVSVRAYSSAGEFIEQYDPHQPGCIVLDIRMPRMSGLELQEQLNQRGSILPIIVITGHGNVPTCVRAFQGGAFAFLEKPIDHQQLLDHIQHAIAQNERSRRTRLSDTLLVSKCETLTPRERDVMDLLATGKPMKLIALQLEVSVQTCSRHRASVMDKMGVDNDVELVRLLLLAEHDQ